MIEGFEELKGFPNYLINKEGKIWTKLKNRFLKHSISDEYFVVSLVDDDGKYKKLRVHRLLGIQYIENPNNLEFIDHIDRNRQNNSLDNLRWISKMGNNNNRSIRGCIHQEKHTKGHIEEKYYWKGQINIMGKCYSKVSKYKEVVEEWLKKIKEEHSIEC